MTRGLSHVLYFFFSIRISHVNHRIQIQIANKTEYVFNRKYIFLRLCPFHFLFECLLTFFFILFQLIYLVIYIHIFQQNNNKSYNKKRYRFLKIKSS